MTVIKNIILIFFAFVSVKVAGQEQEKLYIQTDKPGYHAGETIWFRIDVLPAGSKIAYIELLDSINTPVLQEKIQLTDSWGAGSFAIPPDLAPGTYLLRGYTNWMKNYGAEGFFTKRVAVINLLRSREIIPAINTTESHELNIDLKTDKKVYRTREKVRVELSTLPNQNISVSVYKLDSLQSKNTGYTNQPPVTVKHTNFIREDNGNIVTGKVTDIKTGGPVANTSCYLSIIGPVNMFYATSSDSMGNIMFEVNNVYGDNQVVLQTADSNCRIEIDDGFSKEFTTVVDSPGFVVYDYNTLVDHAVSVQVQLIYDRKRDSVDIFIGDTLPIYGYAEYNYNVDEYVKFSSVEDIFREYIRPVQIYKREGRMVPIIFLDKERRLMNGSPFLLIDNVPVFDMQKLMMINPAKIQRIDVVDRPYWFHQQFYEGIISVFTKTKDPEDYLSPNATVQNFKGLQLTKKFYSPLYDTETKRNDRLPDFRNVLFWSPNINSQSIEFYTSDLPGNYVVVAQSINDSGKIINKVTKFVVE